MKDIITLNRIFIPSLPWKQQKLRFDLKSFL